MMFIKCKENTKINNAVAVVEIFRDILKSEDKTDQVKEHFWGMGVNIKNRVLYIELISLGSLTESIVHPREVFKSAILKNVVSLIFCHNHPSGDPEPSKNDIDITDRLRKGAEILGLRILDHIIITEDGYFSFTMENLLKGGNDIE
ncbi:DNA repair protein RadC [Candidatus Atribacteria bacterium 1244-E10-H5-B2]|nr:MAG: DNA repair protein RadC [Candidatus Atribacteria bacterium 1244-E10-H5-B2]